MSETPRTDAFIEQHPDGYGWRPFARRLECALRHMDDVLNDPFHAAMSAWCDGCRDVRALLAKPDIPYFLKPQPHHSNDHVHHVSRWQQRRKAK
jgi:hypothetical protein